jgi:phosphate transport system substrate-binding protein
MSPRIQLITGIALFILLGLQACGPGTVGYEEDTHSRGKAVIYFEESYKPLFETSIYTFEGLYPSADIKPVYTTEGAIIKSFFERKVKTICITRDFTAKEKKNLKKRSIEVRSNLIAFDAIALIIHPDNADSTISVDRIKAILTGKDTLWSNGKKINVVFDNAGSANFNYLHNLVDKAPLAKNIFAVKSNEQVIKHVKSNPSSIGIIGVNWISDHDDKNVLNFLKGIRVMWVSKTERSEAFQPYQAYIYTKEYPLTREMWVINMGSRSGLHSGFVNFMQQEKGQLIIHKSALVTATSPVRMIEMTTE